MGIQAVELFPVLISVLLRSLHITFLEGRQEIRVQKPIPFILAQDNQEISLPKINIILPPRTLLNFLDNLSPLIKVEVLKLRDKMLGSDQRIREIKDGKSIFYGLFSLAVKLNLEIN